MLKVALDGQLFTLSGFSSTTACFLRPYQLNVAVFNYFILKVREEAPTGHTFKNRKALVRIIYFKN